MKRILRGIGYIGFAAAGLGFIGICAIFVGIVWLWNQLIGWLWPSYPDGTAKCEMLNKFDDAVCGPATEGGKRKAAEQAVHATQHHSSGIGFWQIMLVVIVIIAIIVIAKALNNHLWAVRMVRQRDSMKAHKTQGPFPIRKVYDITMFANYDDIQQVYDGKDTSRNILTCDQETLYGGYYAAKTPNQHANMV